MPQALASRPGERVMFDHTPLTLDYTHGDTVIAEGLGAGTVLYVIWCLVTRKRIVPKAVVVDHGEGGFWRYSPQALRKVNA